MRLVNAIHRHADSLDSTRPVARWGLVTGVDMNSATVKVALQPEGVQTDWLPLASSSVGAGWGLVHVPPVGTQVFCMPDAGDHNSYVVMGATWSAQNRPPAGVAQGEVWLVHSTLSSIKLTNDGHVKITDAGGCTFEFTNDGTATLTGALHVTGAIIAGYGGADQVGLTTHVHVEHGIVGGATSPATAGT